MTLFWRNDFMQRNPQAQRRKYTLLSVLQTSDMTWFSRRGTLMKVKLQEVKDKVKVTLEGGAE